MKITQEQINNGEDLINAIIEKAWTDSQFKHQLVNNPTKTISKFVGKELGNKMPNGKELIVMDQTDESKFYLNIPARPTYEEELTDQQLELVAGGATGPFYDAGVYVGEKIKEFYNWATS